MKLFTGRTTAADQNEICNRVFQQNQKRLPTPFPIPFPIGWTTMTGSAKHQKLKVFISYSREDLSFADELVAGLAYDGRY
jgi:hypothetical protein